MSDGGLHLMLVRWWRNRGWQRADESLYRAVYEAHGGSVVTHPDFIVAATELASVPLRYRVSREQDSNGLPLAAVATWGDYVACTKKAVQHFNVRDRIDLGQSEVILPMSPEYRGTLGYRCEYLSSLHKDNILNAKKMDAEQALAKGIFLGEERVSNKLRKSIRYYERIFEKEGGEVKVVMDLTAAELADEYRTLFASRWDKLPMASDNLETIFTTLWPFITGNRLLVNGEPIAVQILYAAHSCRFLSVEYINGGMHSGYEEFNPGTLLNYYNVAMIEKEAEAAGLAMHYSFGRFDAEYKRRWCDDVSAFRT